MDEPRQDPAGRETAFAVRGLTVNNPHYRWLWMALLGRPHTSQELCGVPGIDDVEGHVRKALNDHLTMYGGHLNGRYDSAVSDLMATAITELIPEYDESKAGGASVSTYTYRRLRQRDIIQWYRDNIRDTRYGRPCPDCTDEKDRLRERIAVSKAAGGNVDVLKGALLGFRTTDTKWAGSDQRECRRCGLVFDDFVEVGLPSDDVGAQADSTFELVVLRQRLEERLAA